MALSSTTADKIEDNSHDTSYGKVETEEETTGDKKTVENNKNTTCEFSSNTQTTSDHTAVMERLLMHCLICDERYSDERVPRNLNCGHSICTDCANKCVASRKQCPECREMQHANTVSDFPINYPLRRLVRAVMDNEINLKDIRVPPVPLPIPGVAIYLDAGQCRVHDTPLLFLCLSCSTWVCQDCLVVDHRYFPRGSCKILTIIEAMEEIRKEHNRNTVLAKSDVDHIVKNLEPVIAKHKMYMKFDVCGDIRSHIRLIREIERGLDVIKGEDHATAEKAMQKLDELSVSANETPSPSEITSICKELLECMSNLKHYISLESERKMTVLEDIKTHLKMDLKLLVNQKAPVYAAREESGKVRYSAIRSNDDRMLLYSLSEDIPPKDSILIPYETIMELIPLANRTIFFEVGTSNESFGVVYIKLFDETLGSRQACLLCTGENGPCYKNTCFYEYDEQESLLKGGDYMNNDGTGGQGILPDVQEYLSHNVGSGSKGLFVANDQLHSQFHFLLKDSGNYVVNVLGQVHKGLEVLIAASRIKPVTNCVLRECGLFIPMKSKESSS